MNALYLPDAHALRRWRRPSARAASRRSEGARQARMRPAHRSTALVDFATVVVRLDVSRGFIDGGPFAAPNGVACE